MLYALGRWSYRHHRRVIAIWAALIIGLGVLAVGFGNGTRNEFEIPGTESQDAIDQLARTFPEVSGAGAVLVVVAPGQQQVDTAESRALFADAVSDVEKLPGVADVISPFAKGNTIGVSGDGRAAQLLVSYDRQLEDVSPTAKEDLTRTAQPLDDAGYTTAWGGDVFTVTGPQLSIIEVFGVVLAFVVLYLMFRSLRAAVIPVVTALVGVIVSVAAITAATGIMVIPSTAPLMALMVGLAVGIDYALFIVSRHREQLFDGLDPEESSARAIATSGSAVVFAGITVVIALVGLAIARIPFLTVIGVSAGAAVVVSVAVALTLLPAMLGRAGERLRPTTDDPPGAFSRRWVLAVIRFPKAAIAIIVIALAVVAIPSQHLRLALPDNGSAPHDSSQRIAFDLTEDHFGSGFNGPLLVTADIITTTDPVGVVDAIKADLAAVPGVEAIGLATPNRTGDAAIWQVIPSSGPSDEETHELVDTIRGMAPKWQDEHGVDVKITGITAGGIDVSERLKEALLPFGIAVVGLSVLLLMIVFRTIVVPLKATLGFLLSTGAAFGAVVAVFQWGWLGPLVNLDHPGPLMSFLPIMVIAVLFGLSMDYEVFLMSRMKEEYVRFGDPHRAIVDGFVGSSRVVTAAAVIMLAVFAGFVPEGDPGVRPIAFALAIGVFVDAFLIRMLFAPAVLQLFGAQSWALPRMLDKVMPHVDVEGEALHRRVELESWPSRGSDAAITSAGLTTSAAEGVVFNDVTTALPAGDWLIVHGPSGSGKTALLLTFAGRMPFSDGRLRVAGHLLPQEARAVRKAVALAEFRGVNDLEDNLTVDQHIAERLSIRRFGFWVSRSQITPVRHRWNDALAVALGPDDPFREPIAGTALVATLSPLERITLAVSLALIGDPQIVVLDDADDVRSPETQQALWVAVARLLNGTGCALAASVQSDFSAPPPTILGRPDRLHLLELDTSRTLSELML